MRTLITLLVFFASISTLLSSTGIALESENTFEYAPKAMKVDVFSKAIAIKDYSVKYEGDIVKDILGSKGIKHTLVLKNTSRRDIVAVQVGFVYFNYFNEPVGYTSTLILDRLPKGEEKEIEAKGKFVGDATTYGSFAFVHKIKYSDRSVEMIDAEIVKKKINSILGTSWGDEMFDDPETQSRRKFSVTSLVGFLL